MDIPLTRYAAALAALYARTGGGTKFGLERTEAILDALGSPHRALRCFHIAGTNGKGSVCATLDALLRRPGCRVGRYTSPHLVDFRERILVDGRPISEAAVVDWIGRHMPLIERTGATFFEATTALAFHHFVDQGVDVAVIETGLGGRLDSTNVVRPLVAVVTSIGLDHTNMLGTTLEQIAAEKAGIFKAAVPAVIGERDDAIADLLRRFAMERGASAVRSLDALRRPNDIVLAGDSTRFSWRQDDRQWALATPLLGEHQAWNASTALLALHAAGPAWLPSETEARARLARVRLAGRFQRIGHRVFDVAHNVAGSTVLAQSLRATGAPRPLVALLSVLADKDWRGMMRALATVTDRFVLTTAPTAPPDRAWHAMEALEHARATGLRAELCEDFDAALARADDHAATTLITGSFHTVGDAMLRLQVDPLGG